MKQDYLGNDITDATESVLLAVNDFTHGFLSYQNKATHILRHVDQHPSCLMANCYAGFLWMFLESPLASEKASVYVARAMAAEGTEREQLNALILRAWADGEIPTCLEHCETVIRNWPTDLTVLKLAQYHMFNLGDAPGMLRVGLAAAQANGAAPYVHGMIAFGYEQCHLMSEAEAAARSALRIQPDDPWAHHALAHVMLTQGRVDEGIAFLTSVSDTWRDLNSFMHTHNWWHLALFYISKGRSDDVLAIYDQHVWAKEKDYSQDQVGAVSLLARMEFAGIPVGARWSDLADHIANRGADTVSPFLTLQYYYALLRANRPEAAAMFVAIEVRTTDSTHDQSAWAEVALPAAQGMRSLAEGDPLTAAKLLGIALPRMAEIGGSHAQRDLFEQIRLDALVRSGQHAAAQQVLEMRRTFDPDGIPLNRLLGEVYEKVGLPTLAQKARLRAESFAQR